MRRLAPLLLLPLVSLVGCGDDAAEDPIAAPATSTTTTTSTAPAPPTDLCQELNNAVGADSREGREGAFAALHEGLADGDADVHEAIAVLEAELEEPQDGEALARAMGVLNAELDCGG